MLGAGHDLRLGLGLFFSLVLGEEWILGVVVSLRLIDVLVWVMFRLNFEFWIKVRVVASL